MHLVIGDIHVKNVSDLEKEIDLERLDSLICTSDFDSVDSIKDYLSFRDKAKKEGAEIIGVGGNHDDAIYNDTSIASTTIGGPYKEFEEIVDELRSDKTARDHIKRILDNPVKETEINNMNTVVVHGGLAGNLRSFPACPKDKQVFWNRLYRKKDYENNMELMDQKGYDLMLRGHDHEPEIVKSSPEGLNYIYPDDGEEYNLSEDRTILTHGAFLDGWYLTIEDDKARYENINY
jgi:predicted phosphodiesterase